MAPAAARSIECLRLCNSDCQEVHYSDIPSNQMVTQPTYANNLWRVRDRDTQELLNETTATVAPLTVSLP